MKDQTLAMVCWCGHTASDHDWPGGSCTALVDVQAAAPGMEPCACGEFASPAQCAAEMAQEAAETE